MAAKKGKGSIPKAGSRQASAGSSKRRTPRKATSGKDPAKNEDFLVAGVGASAGGLEALEAFFRVMPPDSGVAFIVVTHLHPGHASILPELLAKVTQLPVSEATDNAAIEKNQVYVAPAGSVLSIRQGRLQVTRDGQSASRLPIDAFFRSLADQYKSRAICVVLSGTGTDGTLGVRAIKGESGMVMAQDVRTASYAGMPSSAINTGLVDYVLAPGDMPGQLLSYVQGHQVAPESNAGVELQDGLLDHIFSLLKTRVGHDFSDYKASTIRRRVERRMNVHTIDDAWTYVRLLEENPQEVDLLFKELLITVTSFFRDPLAFRALEAALIELITEKPEGDVFRVWVPGCATGEETYSIAILIDECLSRLQRHMDVQIFSTDLDATSIEVARAGFYPEGIANDVDKARLERYFVREDAGYRVRKEIRDMVIFAPQNVVADPPFTKLDLVSCRNLLIYMNTSLQKRLLPIFHYSLKPDGILFLGPSENVGVFSEHFHTIDKKWKVFRRIETATRLYPPAEYAALPPFPGYRASALPRTDSKPVQITAAMEKLLLSRFAPTSVVISERGDIIYIHGRTGEYLDLATGQPRLNVLDMAREGLAVELATAIRQAMAENKEVIRKDVRVKTNGDHAVIDVVVVPLKEPETVRGLLLVSFLRPTAITGSSSKQPRQSRRKDSDALALELQHARESLQSTIEELETSNEELKSANEELQSMNEELQSTNEELETSKEEMQSLNEELTTVNTELESKVEELSQSNNDMQNLLNSTEIATIFLDDQLNIKRYTEKATNLVKLIPTDVGRSLGDLATNLDHGSLLADCQQVLDTLKRNETEVYTKDGSKYLMRIMPYRTVENAIDGLVLTFIDIVTLANVELITSYNVMLRDVLDGFSEPAVILDDDSESVIANREFSNLLGLPASQLAKKKPADLLHLPGGQTDLEKRLAAVLGKHRKSDELLVTAEFPRIGKRHFLLRMHRIDLPSPDAAMVLVSLTEANNTERPDDFR